MTKPFRRAIALVGDGAFRMTGMELLTAKELNLNPIVIVVNNGSFASLRMMGHQQADFVNIPSLDYRQLAIAMGGQGFVIETGKQLRQALRKARESDIFSLLDVHLSPDDVSPASRRIGDLFAKTLKG